MQNDQMELLFGVLNSEVSNMEFIFILIYGFIWVFAQSVIIKKICKEKKCGPIVYGPCASMTSHRIGTEQEPNFYKGK